MTEIEKSKKITFSLCSVPQRTNVSLQIPEEREEIDYITGINRTGKILGSRKKKEEPLVIPLEEGWTKKYLDYQKIAILAKSGADVKNLLDSVLPDRKSISDDEQRNLVTIQMQESWRQGIDDQSVAYNMSLPPILRNRPPGLDKIEDERKKYLYDVDSRPDGADLEAYHKMPLDKFGEAMLRGMGWREGMPIGRNAEHAQPVITYIRQPARLGLGATPKPPEKRPEGWIPKPGESREPPQVMALPRDKEGRVRHYKTLDEKLVPVRDQFYPGSSVFIVSGIHSGLRVVVERREGTTAVLVRLPSDEKVIVDLKDIDHDSGDPRPTPTSSPDDHKRKHKKRKWDSTADDSEGGSGGSGGVKSFGGGGTKSKLSKNNVPPPPPSPTIPWLMTDIRVKVCSKQLEEGRYYCKYAWVVDVLPERCCVLRIESPGSPLLEGVPQEDLETVVPSLRGTPVMIVRGEHRGEVGTLYERDGVKGIVYVQLDDDMEIYPLGYDDVAQCRDS